MGFDNECIPNIQTLAGEYFCPVCRLLVYPNEALQSQCTHLYCKPCLTYIVSTTRACPYDGYLVTESDSKPLNESNKALAETIGKINVHCLYHRSGCTWQGPLSECTAHCLGCAFGNSPVVCNRCSVQIVHRQVQEHAQNCPGVQMQAQPVAVSQSTAVGPAAAGNQTQAVAATTASQAQRSGVTTSSLAAQAPTQQPVATVAGVATTAAPTAEQWYQQQQQYQQYYQQYPGYDPYQQQYQQYYGYPQQAVPQHQPAQPQAHPPAQTQSQPQAQPLAQPPVAAQPQNLAQVNIPQQTYPPMQPQGHPQPQSHLQTLPVHPQPQNLQIPQYQQPFPQVQQVPPQTQVQVPLQPQVHSQQQAQAVLHHPQPLAQPANQAQVPSAQAVTGHHSYPQGQPHQQIQPGAPQNPVMLPQSGPPPQLPAQGQLPLQPALLRPPQQPGLVPSPVQASAVPTHSQPVQFHTLHPGLPVHQQPMLPVQQPMHQQYAQIQQPHPGQQSGPVQSYLPQQGPYLHQQHLQPQLHPQCPSQSFPQNVGLPQGLQPHQAQSQTSSGWPMVPPHGALAHAYAQSTAGMQVRPMHVGNQQSGNILRTSNQPQVSSEQKSGHTSGELSDRQGTNTELPYQKTDKNDPSNLDVVSAPGSTAELKSIKVPSDVKTVENGDKTMVSLEGGDRFNKQVKEEPLEGKQKDGPSVGHGEKDLSLSESKEMKDGSLLKNPSLEAVHPRELAMKIQNQGQIGSLGERGKQQLPPTSYGPSGMQMPFGPLQAPPTGPFGGQISQPVQPLVPPSGILQQQAFKQPFGPENLGGNVPVSGPTSAFVRGPSGYASQHGPSTQTRVPPSHGERTPSEMFPDQRSTFSDGRHAPPGQHFGMESNATRRNAPPLVDSSLPHGLRDDRFGSLVEPFTEDPSRLQREFEDGFKHFPRPSQIEPPRFGPHFSASGPLERGPPSFGMDVAARPPGKGLHGPSYDSGLKVDPRGGPRPFPPYHHDGTLHPGDLGGRPTGFHETGMPDSARAHLGPVPGYGHRHMDGLAPRSPGLDHPGMPPRLFGAFPGGDDIDGQESRQFADPLGSSLHDKRFSAFPGHFRRGEFEASGMRLGDYNSGGEHFGSRIMHNHPRLRDGFGSFGDGLGGMGPGNFRPPRFGEPGFRSTFTSKGFPSGGGRYTVKGDIDTFDNPRRRKPSSMGWCRICKVDCETVEGLDLHSQTKEHQKMAMDMVLTIKQNAKKQKMAVGGKPPLDDSSNMKSANSEGPESKH